MKFGHIEFSVKLILPMLLLSFISCDDSNFDDEDEVPNSSFYTVGVDANTTMNNSGKNDMEILRNYFSSASQTSDNLSKTPESLLWETESNYAQMIGFNRIRLINYEYGTLDSEGNYIGNSILNSFLDKIHAHNWDLHFIVAQDKPSFMEGNAWEWNEEQWNEYEEYAYKCIEYVMNQYDVGFQQLIVEVSNEVDISGSTGYWFVNGNYNNASMEAYEGYTKCYSQWSDAVKRFNLANPNKKVKLFGPAISAYTIIYGNEGNKWTLKLIEDASKNNWQLDAVSFHQYNSGVLGNRVDYTNGRLPRFRNTIGEIQARLNMYGLKDTEIWLTEWFANSWFETDRININYQPIGGAFAAAFMHEALDLGVDGMVPLRLRDPNTDYRWFTIGSLATINQKVYPKPIYNVFKMFYQLPGERKKVEWEKTNVHLGAIASADKNKVGVIIYNYDWDTESISDKTEAREVQIKLTGAQFSGEVTVKRFLMDNDHSNLAKFVDKGIAPSLPECELQQVDEFKVEMVNDVITLPECTLGKSAVSLWVIEK